MKVSMFTKEEMHAEQAEFRLLVLISKYARDPWRRSLTSQTDHWGEWGAFSPSIGPQRKCHANVRPWDAQSCRPKGRCFPFTPSQKIAVEGSFILGDSNWKLFQIGFPVDTHTDMIFFTKGYRSRIARLSLGWSLVDGRNGFFGWNLRPCQFYKEYIQTDQRTQIHFDTLAPSAKIKIKKGEKPFSQETLQKKKGKSTKEANEHTNPQQEWHL